jgi:type IX secretion system substrate protein
MKHILLTLSAFICTVQLNAQCGPPPPPGMSPIFSIDMDNDGYTTFDIGYFISNFDRPNMELIHNVSSSGYNFTFYNSNNQLSGLNYTNIQLNEMCSIHYEYTGSGPLFEPQPPCYWPVPTENAVRLTVVPHNGDTDSDGVLNVDEDTNHNLNLMDDDDDNDGLINLLDALVPLGSTHFEKPGLAISPNPVTSGFIDVNSDIAISSVTVYDLSGRQIFTKSMPGNILKLDTLATGTYILKFQTKSGDILKKVVIE